MLNGSILLCSQVAPALGKILSASIQVLNVEGIGLGLSGFRELQDGITKDLKLVEINIRFKMLDTFSSILYIRLPVD